MNKLRPLIFSWGFAIFVLALLLRLAYLLEMRGSLRFAFPVVDAYYHDQWARSIAAGDWMGKEAFFRAPLYPYMVAVIYRLFGPDAWTVRVFQALLGSLTAFLVYRMGLRLYGKLAGIVAGFLAATYWVFIYYEGELLIETTSVFLQTLLLMALIAAWEKPGIGRYLGAGMLLGLAADARPNVLLFGLAAVLAVALSKSPGARAMRLRLAGAFALGALLMIAPVTLRNWHVSGEPVLISWQGGSSYYSGNNPAADGVSPNIPGIRAYWWEGFRDMVQIAEAHAGHQLSPNQVSRFWFGQAMDFARHRPGAFLRLQARKLGVFWYGKEKGDDADVNLRRRESHLLSMLPVGFAIVASLGLLGIVLTWNGPRSGRILVLYVVTWMISVVLFFVTSRFRLPVVPALIVLAGGSVSLTAGWVRARGWPKAGVAAAGTIVLAVLMTADFYGLGRDNVPQEAFNRGVMLARAHRLEEAEAAYREAIRAAPGYVDARNNLAITLQDLGRLEEAKAELDTLIAAAPTHATAHFNRGVVQERLGQRDAARASYELALSLDPDHVETLFALGGLAQKEDRREDALGYYLRALTAYDKLERETPSAAKEERAGLTSSLVRAYLFIGQEELARGDSERGIASFQRAAALDPLSSGAHHALGKTYLFLGKPEEAEAELRTAIGLDPEGVDARYALALHYSSKGELRQAAGQFEEILRIDPRHKGALFNLGVVRARQGLLDAAIEAWEKELAIDPTDADARKNLERARAAKGH